MDSGGYRKLSELFFAGNYPDLQVTARRRKAAFNTTVAVPVGTSTTITTNVAMDPTDNLKAGDGIIFDYVALEWGVNQAGGGGNLQGAIFQVLDSQGHFGTLSQPVTTTFTSAANSGFGLNAIIFDVNPRLWSVDDLNFLVLGSLGLFMLTHQPLLFQIIATISNQSAAAANIVAGLRIFYRVVRGLQEG